jgi:competence protein ComEA
MLKKRKSMAVSAMVFLYLLIGMMGLTACGSKTLEAVDTRQSLESIKEDGADSDPREAVSEAELNGKPDTVFVYVCGAVQAPGVYELPGSARVCQAIEAAGGLRPDADTLGTNQAQVLKDGEQVTILTKEEAKSRPQTGSDGPKDGSNGTGDAGKVNLNTAGAAELTTLSGIGQSRANDIISYREENGSFQKIEDIMKVSGIKTALFNRIKDRITVS